jgi:hypothetical protein
MLLSLAQALIPSFAALPLYVTFPAIALGVMVISVGATLITRPTDRQTLLRFYREVRPWGFWGPVAREAGPLAATHAGWDIWTIIAGIPWLIALYLLPVYVVLHRFTEATVSGGIVAALSVVLYATWFKRLETE